MKAISMKELLEKARNWAKAQSPVNEELRNALFEEHLADLINEMIREARNEADG